MMGYATDSRHEFVELPLGTDAALGFRIQAHGKRVSEIADEIGVPEIVLHRILDNELTVRHMDREKIIRFVRGG